MKGINYYSGNKLEKLALACAELMGTNPLPPFAEEIILIQTPGMARWLSLELARCNGIFSSYKFISDEGLVDIAESLFLQPSKEKSPYSRDMFAWSLMSLLEGDFLSVRDMKHLAGYIAESPLRRFQLASRVADIFDQYALYRMEMLSYWEKGKIFDGKNLHENWQFALWRHMEEQYAGKSRHKRLKKVLDSLLPQEAALPFVPAGFPKRIICFGISIMPKYYLDVLAGISAFIPVYLFHMNPSREYWGDILSDKALARLENKRNKKIEHAERGNALLSSFGDSGRDFLTLLYDNNYLGDITELFDEDNPSPLTALQSIQRDITFLADREKDPEKEQIAADDSISFVSCHSPMRELEALHDYLLNLFDKDKTLKPNEILVLCTDINGYAPYIEAVFGAAEKKHRIPYSIADRSIAENKAIRLFLDMLSLFQSRFGAPAVMSIIDTPVIRDKLALDNADIELINSWVTETNIRWGIDAGFQEELGIKYAPVENTWIFGLERMLLGYAMTGDEKNFFDGIYPFDEIEGDSARVLGCFASFILDIAEGARESKREKTPAQWRTFFTGILDNFFVDDGEDEDAVRYMRNQIEILKDIEDVSRLTGRIGFDVMSAYLKARFGNKPAGRGFITGGVTFCSMVPLRSIPFRVIYIVGMNDDLFPRKHIPEAFDLISANPKPGDRDTRKNDRYLFLETILSAREKLCISYVGRSIKDNSPILPSNVVIELQDYIRNSYAFQEQSSFHDFTTEHPLQGTSPAYFRGGKLVSFREDNFEAATSCRDAAQMYEKRVTTADKKQTGAPPIEIKNKINADELVDFFRNTSKFFLNKCLNVDINMESGMLEELEPFELDALQRYKIKNNLLNKESAEIQSFFKIYKSEGSLPAGTIGNYEFNLLSGKAERMREHVRSYTESAERETKIFEQELLGITITAKCALYGGKHIMFRPAKIRPLDRLNLWIHHLVMNCSNFCDSVYIGENNNDGYEILELEGVSGESYDDNFKYLEELIELFKKGHYSPIPFFPKTSWAYIENLHKEKPNRNNVLNAWIGGYIITGERDTDRYVKRCFGGYDDPCFITGFKNDQDISIDGFENTALKVFGGLILNMKES
ncbi:MAG: exodeoxyribonuclease V subunit gamma [Spirochaetia bacterium]|jgi:exodeoxyribonuclease V gamma subunit|nr:exodeoxyribonuclease V subunit gamma [Spirochaetia bacterium]